MPSRRPAFPTPTGLDIWRESQCRACCNVEESAKRLTGEGPGCPLLIRAATGKVVAEWTLKPNAHASERYLCTARTKVAASTRRKTVECETLSMFDAPAEAVALVPVPGWPDRPQPVDLDAVHQ